MASKARKRVNAAMRATCKWRKQRNEFEKKRGLPPAFDHLGVPIPRRRTANDYATVARKVEVIDRIETTELDGDLLNRVAGLAAALRGAVLILPKARSYASPSL